MKQLLKQRMATEMEFQFLSSQKIDRKKWDKTISNDPLAPPYALSWYLETVGDNWGGIVSSDYSCVLPLAYRRKFGFKYIYQPFFTRNTGIYGSLKEQGNLVKSLNTLLNKFQYWDFCLEIDNDPVIHKANISKRIYQFLDLNKSYEEHLKSYSGNTRRGIRDAMKENLFIVPAADPDHFIAQFKKYTSSRIKEFKNQDYERIKLLFLKCKESGEVWFYSVMKDEKEISSFFLVKTGHRITYIEGYSSPEGRNIYAMHLLFDHFIRHHSAQNLILDFGGSNVPSIAHFFHSFGAVDRNYFNIRVNNLPVLISSLKK